MIVADTDVLIDFIAGAEPAASRIVNALERDGLETTAITRFELLSGAKTAKSLDAILTLLAAIPTLPLDQSSADRASEIRKTLERSGQSIAMADSLIAGIVVHHGAELLTRNRKHFTRISGLRLADL